MWWWDGDNVVWSTSCNEGERLLFLVMCCCCCRHDSCVTFAVWCIDEVNALISKNNKNYWKTNSIDKFTRHLPFLDSAIAFFADDELSVATAAAAAALADLLPFGLRFRVYKCNTILLFLYWTNFLKIKQLQFCITF